MNDTRKVTVLVVDDEPDLREILAFGLTRAGFEVVTADGGHEAFAIVQNQEIDAVVTDLGMPEGGGIELLSNIKSLKRSRPIVILITGFADVPVDQLYDRGAEALFTKPASTAALVAAINEGLMPPDVRWTRASTRVTLNGNSVLTISDTAAETDVVNLGRGGMFVAVAAGVELPQINARVKFQFRTVGVRPRMIEGSGVVRWVRSEATPNGPRGCGVEFLQLSEASQAQITVLINEIKTHAFIPRT